MRRSVSSRGGATAQAGPRRRGGDPDVAGEGMLEREDEKQDEPGQPGQRRDAERLGAQAAKPEDVAKAIVTSAPAVGSPSRAIGVVERQLQPRPCLRGLRPFYRPLLGTHHLETGGNLLMSASSTPPGTRRASASSAVSGSAAAAVVVGASQPRRRASGRERRSQARCPAEARPAGGRARRRPPQQRAIRRSGRGAAMAVLRARRSAREVVRRPVAVCALRSSSRRLLS